MGPTSRCGSSICTRWGNVLRGDLGYSIQAGVPVTDLLATNLPATLQLAVLGFSLALLLALAIAFLSNLSGFGGLRSALQSLPSLFVSVPTFWLGIVLIQVFSFQLKLIPVINPGEWEGLILPIVTLAVPISAPLAQILIRSIDQVQTQPFVAVARAKGASRSGVLWRHVARNAMLPALTIAGHFVRRADRRGADHRNRVWPQRAGATDTSGGA
ncbi:Glutathione transport system permease protein gsiC [Serratia plymuthica]|uniref:Glutathione transport system permease protein gsiC n=1 Tax=Serratia plymuthica TaxID=82996 RepID=A0A2X4UXP8_SERPL|nr:Glutathione transport system permease protein gsiC [Serratia plymuthica]